MAMGALGRRGRGGGDGFGSVGRRCCGGAPGRHRVGGLIGARQRLGRRDAALIVVAAERGDRPVVKDLGGDEDDEDGDRDPDQGHP